MENQTESVLWDTIEAPNTIKSLKLMGYEVRYNLLKQATEWSINGGPWQVLFNRDYNVIRETLSMFNDVRHGTTRKPYLLTESRFLSHVDCAGKINEVHPVVEYINNIKPKYSPLLETYMTDWFGCEKSKYNREISKWIFKSVIHRVLNPGCEMRFFPVLVSQKQRVGKSQFCAHILPEQFGAFSDNFSFDMQDKTLIEALEGHNIIEISEMKGANRAQVNKIKAFMTRRHDKMRLAYERKKSEMSRQVMFIGTANGDDISNKFLPIDYSGNTRWLCIELKRQNTKIVQLVNESRDVLFAAAKHDIEENGMWFPEDLVGEQEKVNNKYTNKTNVVVEDAIIEYAEWIDRNRPSLQEIAEKIKLTTYGNLLDGHQQSTLSNALKNQDFEPYSSTNGRRKWRAVSKVMQQYFIGEDLE